VGDGVLLWRKKRRGRRAAEEVENRSMGRVATKGSPSLPRYHLWKPHHACTGARQAHARGRYIGFPCCEIAHPVKFKRRVSIWAGL
jgi:hypothetical protein